MSNGLDPDLRTDILLYLMFAEVISRWQKSQLAKFEVAIQYFNLVGKSG